jgi:uncharacterized protein YuzE
MARKQSSSQHTGEIKFSVFKSKKYIEAIYIKIRDNKIARSKEIGENGEAVIDLNSRGQVVGIEMLEPGFLTVREFNKIARKYDVGGLEDIRIDRLQEAFC